MQCPDCGREVDELIDGSCARCAAKRLEVLRLPDDVPVVRCAHCGRYEAPGGWEEASDDPEADLLDRARRVAQVPSDVVDTRVTLTPRWQDQRHLRVLVQVVGSFHGEPVESSSATVVHVRNGVCGECSRLHGGYFEAILQVRGHPERPIKDPEAVEAAVVGELGRLKGREGSFFSKIDRVRGGLDFYVGSTQVARVLSRELVARWGADRQETATLVGRTKDGQDMYRVTMLVRLPPYEAGDFVRLDGTVYKILDVARKTLRLLSLDDWSVARKEPARAGEVRIVARRADEHDAIVVSQTGPDAQILDPASYRTIDVRLPRPDPLGEQARVVRADDRLWVVPDRAAAQASE